MMAFNEITAFTLLDLYLESQMKLMLFYMLNMKIILEGSEK